MEAGRTRRVRRRKLRDCKMHATASTPPHLGALLAMLAGEAQKWTQELGRETFAAMQSTFEEVMNDNARLPKFLESVDADLAATGIVAGAGLLLSFQMATLLLRPFFLPVWLGYRVLTNSARLAFIGAVFYLLQSQSRHPLPSLRDGAH